MSRNVGRSIKDRIRRIAKDSSWDMEVVLRHYVLERFIHRVSISDWSDQYAIKGGLLVSLWSGGDLYRPTADLDLNGFDADKTINDLKEMIEDVVTIAPKEDDGVVFDISNLKIAKSREGVVPGGKVIFDAFVDTAKVRVRIDVGFGNVITPDVDVVSYPSLIHKHTSEIYACPVETTLSEKFHAMVQHGSFNTRLKDYYDCWFLSEIMEIDPETASLAIHNTLSQQEKEVPVGIPSALGDDFIAENELKWDKYRSTETLMFSPPPLKEVVHHLRDFYIPLCERAREMDRRSLSLSL